MNLGLTDQIDNESKSELQGLMSRLLDLMREILASIHEEHIILESDQLSTLDSLIEHRQKLIDRYENYYNQFNGLTSSLFEFSSEELSFFQILEHIKNHLLPEDLELLLLIDQLACIIKEMQGKTNNLVNFLEIKSANLYTHNMLIKKVSTPQVRLAVEVADDNNFEN